PEICVSVFYLLREEGKEDTVLAKLRSVSEQTGHEVAITRLAQTLYRRQDFAGSLGALEINRDGTIPGLLRPVVLADQDGNTTRGLTAYKNLARRDLEGRRRLQSLMILRLLGYQEDSVALCLDLSKVPNRFPAIRRERFRRLVEYAAGNLSAEKLL